jgi:hypothetical protein
MFSEAAGALDANAAGLPPKRPPGRREIRTDDDAVVACEIVWRRRPTPMTKVSRTCATANARRTELRDLGDGELEHDASAFAAVRVAELQLHTTGNHRRRVLVQDGKHVDRVGRTDLDAHVLRHQRREARELLGEDAGRVVGVLCEVRRTA